jgi:hypothetical protein
MISNEQYHADSAVSASHLKAVMQSPYHYWSRYVDPNRKPVEATAAMKLGSLAHCAILEPDELLQRYGICAPRNTKAGKEQAAAMEAEGIEVVTSNDMALAMGMSAAVRNHRAAAALLKQGKAEQSFWWDDLPTGMRCKCRPDWYYGSTVVDIKTTTDASPQAFARSVATFGYHVQAAHYLAGLHGAERFVFVAVEKTHPHAVGVYELDADALALGRTTRDNALDVIAGCHAANVWPGYSDTFIHTISLPKWATNPIQTEIF